ncbi:DUF4900 domain-containing protein [Deinococcus sp. 12RED42]|uniref:DUF4900 domain-containing protein n=1 Tax=Deinococcus sp. 12RED42 TaxID=2745872 RepID=UPI001E4F4FCC|nr:DUF4900 domain-containing protein [Deinococcus sp. 12RED42]MCD0164464.1 hypothetical protein [Deinococcus sp. 12RED42]
MTTIVTVLGGCLVIAVVLSMTATVTLNSQRNTTDNRLGLEAQYAAESALARAQAQADLYAKSLNSVVIPQGTQQSSILTQLGAVCGLPSAVTLPLNIFNLPVTGEKLCTVPVLTGSALDDQLAFFRNNVAKPAGMSDDAWKTYWRNMFGGKNAVLLAKTNAVPTTATGTLTTEVKGGLTMTEVRAYPDNTMRVLITSNPVVSSTTLESGGKVIAQRTYSAGSVQSREIKVSQPPFSEYQYFVNRRTLPTGGRLNFFDGETFEGKVHSNGIQGVSAPLFNASTSNGGPRFLGKYSSVSSSLEYSSSAKPSASTMFKGGYQPNASKVDLPKNANDQRLAAAGVKAGECVLTTATCLADKFGAASVSITNGIKDGVYFSSGTATASNTGSGFGSNGTGGIYVKGNVDDLKLSKNGDFQRIEIVQAGKTTTFEQTGPTSWRVKEGSTVIKTMTNSTFNGMVFVDGAIGDQDTKGSKGLRGDGTDTPDVAAESQLTVAASGDIFIKDNLTYTDNAKDKPNSGNVLGVYSEGGNIKVNGPMNKDITIDGTLMASATGKGFGTVDYTALRTTGSTTPKINLTGGIIEEQSQGVNQGGTPMRGYTRNFKWDDRLAKGLTPPFFPTQGRYEATPNFTRLSDPQNFRAEQQQ